MPQQPVTFNPAAARTKIVIQTTTLTNDGYGHAGGATVDVLTTWAEVKHLRGQLQLLALQVASTQMATFRIRYAPSVTITPGMRVVDPSGTHWLIDDVTDPNNTHRVLDLLCRVTPGA